MKKESIKKIFKDKLKIEEEISSTPNFKYELNIQTQRSNEILDWLEHNIIDEWVVVDDINMGSYIKNFIHIKDPKLGLKSNDIKNKIISILK